MIFRTAPLVLFPIWTWLLYFLPQSVTCERDFLAEESRVRNIQLHHGLEGQCSCVCFANYLHKALFTLPFNRGGVPD